jgi:hypothetical protein
MDYICSSHSDAIIHATVLSENFSKRQQSRVKSELAKAGVIDLESG